jgi:NRPS condensation-like uncharacterized protein
VATTQLNILDELYLHLDRPDEPWSVHLEVGVGGRVDDDRLAEAITVGAHPHPIARARLAPVRGTDVGYRWEISDELDTAPLEVVDCQGDDALSQAREQLLSTSPSLETAPPFAVTLAHHPDGDAIMLNLCHAAGDGMSALRLMASFLRAYAGETEPAIPVDPLDVRDIGQLVNSRSVGARVARGRALFEQAGRVTRSPTRIAPDGAKNRPGYGFELLRLDSSEMNTVMGHRTADTTVNDVLLGALAIAVRRWNERHGDAATGRIGLMMPINLRPPEWRTEVVGNFASYVSVGFDQKDQAGLERAIGAAGVRTREIKDRGEAGLMVDLLELPTAALPTGLKQRFQNLITLTGDRFVDTAVLSNLGRLDPLPELDAEAGAVEAVWFSPPGRMPLGASLGAASYDGQLFLTLRYRHALFDRSAAAEFAAILRAVLTDTPTKTSP